MSFMDDVMSGDISIGGPYVDGPEIFKPLALGASLLLGLGMLVKGSGGSKLKTAAKVAKVAKSKPIADAVRKGFSSGANAVRSASSKIEDMYGHYRKLSQEEIKALLKSIVEKVEREGRGYTNEEITLMNFLVSLLNDK